MPSKTKKQATLMAACAHGAGYKKCPPAKVAKEFNKADVKTGILKTKAKADRGR
jgi:hypothetical protein